MLYKKHTKLVVTFFSIKNSFKARKLLLKIVLPARKMLKNGVRNVKILKAERDCFG